MRNFRILLGIILLLSIWAFSGCNENVSDPGLNQGTLEKIVQHVSVGGCDAFPPGTDRSFSLVANKNSNGEVSGQWQDGFGGGAGGIHVAVDCLIIDGNSAIVGGVITHGTWYGTDVSGWRAVTKVVDNGTSHNDPADQISYSYFGENFGTCSDYINGNFELLDIFCGQVKVKDSE